MQGPIRNRLRARLERKMLHKQLEKLLKHEHSVLLESFCMKDLKNAALNVVKLLHKRLERKLLRK